MLTKSCSSGPLHLFFIFEIYLRLLQIMHNFAPCETREHLLFASEIMLSYEIVEQHILALWDCFTHSLCA